MLYYICPMHTLFTVFVIVVLYVFKDANGSLLAVLGKLAALTLAIQQLYASPTVFKLVFGTLPVVDPLFSFTDPLHPEFTDKLHEWHFRSGLDRYVWIFGMACALAHAPCARALAKLDEMPCVRGNAWRAACVAVALGATLAWNAAVFSKDKYAYNVLHPYTSMVPVAAFLVLRNIAPSLRWRYMRLFAFLGKYTLETYILQFHVWMRTTGVNGSPKHLLEWVPGYFFVNFAITSAAYILLSVRLSKITMTLRDALIVKDERTLMYQVRARARRPRAALALPPRRARRSRRSRRAPRAERRCRGRGRLLLDRCLPLRAEPGR